MTDAEPEWQAALRHLGHDLHETAAKLDWPDAVLYLDGAAGVARAVKDEMAAKRFELIHQHPYEG